MLYDLKDEQCERIKDKLPGKEGDSGRRGKDNRKFVASVIWIGRTGAPWRALPAEYGKWSSVHKRFMRWARAGVWQMIFNTLEPVHNLFLTRTFSLSSFGFLPHFLK